MSKPPLLGSDGELLTPMEYESSKDEDEPEGDTEPAEVVEEKPDRIPHQLFYPLLVVIWIAVFAFVGYPIATSVQLPFVGSLYIDSRGGTTVNGIVGFILALIVCYIAGYLLCIPTMLFDRLFPPSTQLTMTETYRKAMKLIVQFLWRILNSPSRRVY
jgi:hypothetical protein